MPGDSTATFGSPSQPAGATLCNECSFGGRTRRTDGKRRHEYMQYLEHRRAGTVSAQEMGRVNMFSKAQELTLPAHFYERKISCEHALEVLRALKEEIQERGETFV